MSRELTNKLSSGEIVQMKIGGSASSNIVATMSDLSNIQSAITSLQSQGINSGNAVPGSPNPSLRTVHLEVDKPVVCLHPQDLTALTPDEVRAMSEYCTVGNAFLIEDALKKYVDNRFTELVAYIDATIKGKA